MALWRQADWLTGLPINPDPRVRLAMALLWAVLFAAAALALRAGHPWSRRLIPLLLVTYGVFELSMTHAFTTSSPAVALLMPYAAFVVFAAWALWRPARSSFPIPSAPKEVADRRTL